MTGLVEFGGYKLRFDYNAVCLIEGQTGPQIWDVLEHGMQNPSFIILRAIFWGGLHRENSELSILDAGNILGKLIAQKGPVKMTQELLVALDAAFPDKAVDDTGGGSAGNEDAG